MSPGNGHGNAALIVSGPPSWSPAPLRQALRQAQHTADRSVPAAQAEAVLLTMGAAGDVTVFSGKVDYGQGIRNGFALEVADELDVPVASVRVVLGDTALVPYDRGTTGSASTRTVGIQLRRAAATARRALLRLAAERWEAPADGLRTERGHVVESGAAGRRLSYAELLPAHGLRLAVPEDIATKAPADFVLMGGPAERVDAVARVTGAAKFSRDVTVPGMLHGKVLRPPSYGARLEQIDTARADRVPGVVAIVREGEFAGVVAEREDQAEYALEAVRARWREDRGTASDWNLPGLLKERAHEPVTLRETGDPEAGFAAADHVIEGVYFVPYVSNAQMEPSAAVAAWDGDDLTVWCGSRSPFGERELLAEAFGIGQDRVRVVAAEVGGSFGTKTPTVSVEAARLARAVGRPVRVTYSREEEFAWSTVRPAALIEIRSGTDADGRIVAWDYTAYHSGDSPGRARRGADTPYDTPNVRVAVANSPSPLRSGSYRSLGGAVNHFARELHMDEIAAAVGLDRVEVRMRNLSHPRLRRALTAATEAFGWGERAPAAGEGLGVAVGYDAGSFAAECVHVTVEDREVRVKRVVAGFDCGLVVNPEGARNQVEGAIMMGIGTALWEQVEFDGGRVLNAGFTRYRVPRITDAPEIEVLLVGDASDPSSGAGEPGIVPIAAAVANAVRQATGQPVDALPIVPRLG